MQENKRKRKDARNETFPTLASLWVTEQELKALKGTDMKERLTVWEERYPTHIFKDGSTKFKLVRRVRLEKHYPWVTFVEKGRKDDFELRLLELMQTYEPDLAAEQAVPPSTEELVWHTEEPEMLNDEGCDSDDSTDSDGYGPTVIEDGGQGYSAGH